MPEATLAGLAAAQEAQRAQGRDQVRMSLTHAYRAPGLNDLIALPVLSQNNNPTSPDRIGNPSLKPELSAGLELAYEHYLGNSSVLSANLFTRRVRDLIRRETRLAPPLLSGGAPRWVSAPANIGKARTSGLELEAKFQLTDLFPSAPMIDVRANYSRFWSAVEGVPGPNNRLDQQPKQTANFGMDVNRVGGLPLTLGGSLNWTPATLIQTSATQSTSTGVKRVLDVYGLWKFSPHTNLRLSVGNLGAQDYESGGNITIGNIRQQAAVLGQTYTTWSLKLEIKI